MTDLANLPPRGQNSQFTEAEVEQALLTLIYCAGNSATAVQHLAEQGINVAGRTLRQWRQSYRDRYLQLHEAHGHEIEQHAIAELREAIPSMQAVNRLALENTMRQLEAGEGDPSQILQRSSVAMGIHIDKLRVMTDRPTQITEHHTGEEAMRNLQSRGRIIDTTATELPPNEDA